jgi:hypothetical protein
MSWFGEEKGKRKETNLGNHLTEERGEGELPSLHTDRGSKRLEEVDLQAERK